MAGNREELDLRLKISQQGAGETAKDVGQVDSAVDGIAESADRARDSSGRFVAAAARVGPAGKKAGGEARKGFDLLNRSIGKSAGLMGELEQQIAGMIGAAGLKQFLSSAVAAARQAESSFRGLESVAEHSGVGIGRAFEEARKLAEDGLISVSQSGKALQNLLSRGYDLTQAVGTLQRLKDAAAFNRAAHLSLGEAVVTASEGLKNENSLLVDNAGVTKNVSILWKEYAESIGKGVKSLTQAEKIQAEYNGIQRETEAQAGNAKKALDGLEGSAARLDQSLTSLKASFGATLFPVLEQLAKMGTSVSDDVLKPLFGGLEIMSLKVATGVKTLQDAGNAAVSGDWKTFQEQLITNAQTLNEMALEVVNRYETGVTPAMQRSIDAAERAGAAGNKAGGDIAEGMEGAAAALARNAAATEQQREAFAGLLGEIAGGVGDLDAFAQHIARMRAEGELTEQQFVALQLALQNLRKEAGKPIVAKLEVDSSAADDAKKKADAARAATEGADTVQKQFEQHLADTGDTMEGWGAGLAFLKFMQDYIGAARDRMAELSDGAAAMFDNLMDIYTASRNNRLAPAGAVDEIKELGLEARRIQQDMMFASGELGKWFKQVGLAAAQTKKAFLEQDKSAQAMIDRLEEMDGASQGVVDQAQSMVDGYALLDDQSLAKIQSEVDRLTRANEAMERSAERALERYQDQADPEGAAARRLVRERTDLEEQHQAAVAAGNVEAQRMLEEAMRHQRRAHEEKMDQLEREGRARGDASGPPAGPVLKPYGQADGLPRTGPPSGQGQLPPGAVSTLPIGPQPPSAEFLRLLEELNRLDPKPPLIVMDGEVVSKGVEARMRRNGGVVAESMIAEAATALGHRI